METITLEILQELATWAREHPQTNTLSVYINLDPHIYPTAADRHEALHSAYQKAAQSPKCDDCLDKLKTSLRDLEERLDDGKALAFFCSQDGTLAKTFVLPDAVETAAYYNHAPHLRPLLGMYAPHTYAVCLLTRRHSRIFLTDGYQISLVDEINDFVPSQHQRGGYSQARYARSIDQNVLEHVQNTNETLLKMHEQKQFTHLIVATNEQMLAMTKSHLHTYLAPLAWITNMDLEHIEAKDVLSHVLPVIASHHEEGIHKQQEQLTAAHAHGMRVSWGLTSLLHAINERRVQTMFFQEDFTKPGMQCPFCGYLAVQETVCPVDGTRMEKETDIIEKALEQVLVQSADICPVAEFEETNKEPVGALLRY